MGNINNLNDGDYMEFQEQRRRYYSMISRENEKLPYRNLRMNEKPYYRNIQDFYLENFMTKL